MPKRVIAYNHDNLHRLQRALAYQSRENAERRERLMRMHLGEEGRDLGKYGDAFETFLPLIDRIISWAEEHAVTYQLFVDTDYERNCVHISLEKEGFPTKTVWMEREQAGLEGGLIMSCPSSREFLESHTPMMTETMLNDLTEAFTDSSH